MMLWLPEAVHVVCPKLFSKQFQLPCYVSQNTKVNASLEIYNNTANKKVTQSKRE